MNLRDADSRSSAAWPALLVLVAACAVASADDKKSAPAPSPTPKPASSKSGSADSREKTTAREPRSGSAADRGTSRLGASDSDRRGSDSDHHTTRSTDDRGGHRSDSHKGTGSSDGTPPSAGAPGESGGKSPESGAVHGSGSATGRADHTDHTDRSRDSAAGRTDREHDTSHGREYKPVTGAPSAPRPTPTPWAAREHGTSRGAEGNVHGPTPSSSGAVVAAPPHPPVTTTREYKNTSGQRVQAIYRDGHVRSIQAPNVRIDRGLHGERRVVTETNGRRIVTVGPRMGYSQRFYANRGGHEYVQRTYVYGGRPYSYAYRTYRYRGFHYYAYAPSFYYRPAYYRWVYDPWPTPVRYRWGWDVQPWYGYYGYYFSPYAAYPTAAMWLTDFIIAESLRSAYDAQANAPMAAVSGPRVSPEEQLDPDVKEAIATEVRNQIAAEREAASGPGASGSSDQMPPALGGASRIFVVSSSLDTTMSTGDGCTLTPGDVLMRSNNPVGEDNLVEVIVASAKKDDCYTGSMVTVALDDLQEMHNHLRQLLDTGFKTLADNSGRDGLPSAPEVETRAGEVPPPPLDANVESEVQRQIREADELEAQAQPD